MTPDPNPPDGTTPGPEEAIVRARAQLVDARVALARVTGGTSPRQVLAELAHELASELAAYFDELPMHRFSGRVPRGDGPLSWLLPPRRVPHRVVLGRYLSASVGWQVGGGYTSRVARIAVLSLGADGALRVGQKAEIVRVPKDQEIAIAPLAWDDLLLRRVPTGSLRLRRWDGGSDPVQVASPSRVLEALAAMAAFVAAESNRDLALLQRYL